MDSPFETSDDHRTDIFLNNQPHTYIIPALQYDVYLILYSFVTFLYITGGILASPITEQALTVMKSVIDAKDLTYHIGTKAFDSPGKYVSIEGMYQINS